MRNLLTTIAADLIFYLVILPFMGLINLYYYIKEDSEAIDAISNPYQQFMEEES